MDIIAYFERTNAATSVEELINIYGAAASHRGFEHFALAEIRPATDSPARRYTPIAIRYPGDWVNRYLSQGYGSVDPVVLQVPTRRRALWWSDFDIGEAQRPMMQDALEAGLITGAAVPVHGPFGEALVAGLATGNKDLSPTVLSELNLLSAQFKHCYDALTASPQPPYQPLTERELECLRWSACGKSSSDISEILSISENTVNFHMKNAILKLNACNRIMAIVKGIRMGIISP